MQDEIEKGIATTTSLFDKAQRSVVSEFLHSIVECDSLPNWHPYAKHGLKWWYS